jgi:hypothetical protein
VTLLVHRVIGLGRRIAVLTAGVATATGWVICLHCSTGYGSMPGLVVPCGIGAVLLATAVAHSIRRTPPQHTTRPPA